MRKISEICVGIFTLKQCWRSCLEVGVGAVVKNTKKAKKARNTKKAAGKVLGDEGLGRCGPGGSAESEAGHYNQVIPRRVFAETVVSMSIYLQAKCAPCLCCIQLRY